MLYSCIRSLRTYAAIWEPITRRIDEHEEATRWLEQRSPQVLATFDPSLAYQTLEDIQKGERVQLAFVELRVLTTGPERIRLLRKQWERPKGLHNLSEVWALSSVGNGQDWTGSTFKSPTYTRCSRYSMYA